MNEKSKEMVSVHNQHGLSLSVHSKTQIMTKDFLDLTLTVTGISQTAPIFNQPGPEPDISPISVIQGLSLSYPYHKGM